MFVHHFLFCLEYSTGTQKDIIFIQGPNNRACTFIKYPGLYLALAAIVLQILVHILPSKEFRPRSFPYMKWTLEVLIDSEKIPPYMLIKDPTIIRTLRVSKKWFHGKMAAWVFLRNF